MTYQNVRALSQRINTGATSSLQDVAAATLCIWFVVDSVTAAVRVLHSVSTGASAVIARLELSISTATMRSSARRLDADATSTLNDGVTATAVRHHLAAVARYSTGSLEIYLDGVLNNSVAIAGWTGNSSNTASLGSAIGSTGGGTSVFDGRVADARRYTRALSADEILTLFTANGRDGNLFGGSSRWTCGELGPGQNVVTCIDKWIASLAGTAAGATPPTYTEWIAMPRRRRRRA